MKITPANIKEQQFNKVMRGYDPEEVKTFFDKLCADLEDHLNEHEQLKNDLDKALAKINEYKKIEVNLRNTLLKATESSSQSLDNAKKQSEQIVKEAEEKAAQIIERAQEESESIRSAVISLKEERNMIVARLKAIINSQAALLEMKVESIEKERPLPKRLNENELFEFNIDEIIEKLI
jgi:cell division initiation protein